MNPTIVRLSAQALFGRRRGLMMLVIPVVLLALTLVVRLLTEPGTAYTEIVGELGRDLALPLVALLGCFADGTTVVRGAQELRVKESDRIATVVDGLRGLGAEIEATEDGFAVTGTGELRGGTLEAHGDHRLAMLGAVAGLASNEGVEVIGMEAASVSYPGFERDLEKLLTR